jgi:hypothetical protein
LLWNSLFCHWLYSILPDSSLAASRGRLATTVISSALGSDCFNCFVEVIHPG